MKTRHVVTTKVVTTWVFRRRVMHRRNVLKAVGAAAAGAGLVAASGPAQAEGAKTKTPAANAIRNPFIVTSDGASLFYKDWGAGKPVVFVHSWALNSDMWQY